MGKGKTQVISFRVAEETYGKLKKYADAHGESATALARRVVEEFAQGSPPAPSPRPSPRPGPQPEISEELRELPGRVKKLEEQGVAVFGYVGDLHVKLEEYHRQVSQILAMVQGIFTPPPLPNIPPPPYGVMAERKPGRRKRK